MSSLATPLSCDGWYKWLHDLTLPQSPTLLTLLIIRAMIHGYAIQIEYGAKDHGNAMRRRIPIIQYAFHFSSRVGKGLGMSKAA